MYSLLTATIQQVFYAELVITCLLTGCLIYDYIKNRTLTELLLSMGGIFLLLALLQITFNFKFIEVI